ncbi:MAG: sodium:proton antiporter [Phycisphaerales bacterium]|nr:sodium:proton antiporter [Phycisphaerales bacterium]
MTDSTPRSNVASGRLTGATWLGILGGAVAFAYLSYITYIGKGAGGHEAGRGHTPPLWACFPFAALLLCIALLPLIPFTAHWWEHNRNRLAVSLVFAAMTLAYYAIWDGVATVTTVLQHALMDEYVPFMVLLFCLYVISGGINLRGDLPAHAGTNTAFLGVGALLASFIGTTGASMLLIRPLLQTNSERKHVVHTVIFFIFLVSNIGGSLLPIGDPPLFLGYLRGVPFLWTLNLVWEWLAAIGILLGLYFIVDTVAHNREEKRDLVVDDAVKVPLRLTGKINFAYLLAVVLCVALLDPSKELFGHRPFPLMRELLMVGVVVLSLLTTPVGVRQANKFNYAAILEVAALFIGIFICMQVPIAILHEKGASLGLSLPWHFFWATGALSSFLDNAPTYVVFFETARVLPPVGVTLTLADGGVISTSYLTAVSLGAVFMGAMTYIGNGPNFMVKSIAEQSGVKMPSFFGYMSWSVGILIPLFILLTFLFIR